MRTETEITYLTKNLGSYLDSLKSDPEIRKRIDWRQETEKGLIPDLEVYENPLALSLCCIHFFSTSVGEVYFTNKITSTSVNKSPLV